ncbi:MAG: sulfatase-like hydrolase/transferase [Opitutales bacterium]|jgi:arylsulfatase A|nr:sulfatase-like hydrolase/transferase [Opitutales bacterium]MBT5812871.1 sulfatase-like hydrolase/transferase [Opitutales bacterium]MBT6378654.1 sulfatase-like hydrolase/transferase [Opitutales bacterium]
MKRFLAPVYLLVFCFFAVTFVFASERPNVLLIVSDDQGYNDLGFLGNGILTPALDRLAEEGTHLTQFYVAWSACTPSRASLLTGRYPQRNGIYDMIRNEAPDYGHKYTAAEYEVTWERIGGMDLREMIIPQFLRLAGYRSAIYGKWDLGTLKRYLPTSRGFDDFYGFVNTGVDYYTHERYGVPSMYRNLEKTEEDKGIYCTYLFEREALEFLDENAGERPFFLYVPFNAPHGSSGLEPEIRSSVQAPEEFKKLYPEVDPEFKTVELYRYGSPAEIVTGEARRRDYRAAVSCMDASIGKMLDLLEERMVLDDTIVIFLSDNGGGGGSDNSPLKGGKSRMWEGGIRVPCLIRWPNGKVPAGETNEQFLSSLEILPSLAQASGAVLPKTLMLDGFDWWPVIRGERKSPRREMFWQRKDTVGVRVGKWKWVDMGEQGSGLFDLEQDVAEKNDLSSKRPEVLAELMSRYENWLRTMDAAEPRGPFRDF